MNATPSSPLRLVALAIVVLAGALATGLGSIGNRYSDTHDTGMVLIVAGGVLFLVEFFTTRSRQ